VFVPQPFPYQGSKRRLAPLILQYFPPGAARLVEPFAGSAAVSLASACARRTAAFALNDLNSALMELWERIINAPAEISTQYESLWKRQAEREREFYDEVRTEFNRTGQPDLFLYLLARCVKASIRYNSNGEFNQSPDNRRKGMRPGTMRVQLERTSRLLRGRTRLSSVDYREVLAETTSSDIVYMDPPYQGVCGNRDPRYINGVCFEDFAAALDDLSRRGVPFIVSYDGRTGDKAFGRKLPDELNLAHIEVDAGRSSQATLLGSDAITYESLYLSSDLAAKVGVDHLRKGPRPSPQLALFGDGSWPSRTGSTTTTAGSLSSME